MEVVVYDAFSTDHTAELVKRLSREDDRVKYVVNPKLTQGCAINLAILTGGADYLLWLGAHNEYPVDYLRVCYETIVRTQAHVVGGVCETRLGGPGYGAAVVQALTTHRFGIGGGEFRLGGTEHRVDTVAYALFDTQIFDKIGLFDERLVRAQDYEFNRRVATAGGKIWQNPDIRASYFNQKSFIRFVWKQISLEAPYNAYMWYLAPYSFALRHAVTAAFFLYAVLNAAMFAVWPLGAGVASLVFLVYGGLALISSIQLALRYRRLSFAATLPACFLLFHLAHGAGVWFGALALLSGRAPVQRAGAPWRGAADDWKATRTWLADRLKSE